METGEIPSFGPSRCSACLFLSFALRLANLYEVPLRKCEGDGKGLQALFIVFLHQFLSLSYLSRSLLHLSFSYLTSSTSLHSQSIHMTYETFTKLFCCSYSPYTWRTKRWQTWMACQSYLSFSQSVHATYETMTDYCQCGAHSGSPNYYSSLTNLQQNCLIFLTHTSTDACR